MNFEEGTIVEGTSVYLGGGAYYGPQIAPSGGFGTEFGVYFTSDYRAVMEGPYTDHGVGGKLGTLGVNTGMVSALDKHGKTVYQGLKFGVEATTPTASFQAYSSFGKGEIIYKSPVMPFDQYSHEFTERLNDERGFYDTYFKSPNGLIDAKLK